MSEETKLTILPAPATSLPTTSTTRYQWPELSRDLSYLPITLFHIVRALLAYDETGRWRDATPQNKFVITFGTLCALSLPLQLANLLHMYRRYDWRPYTTDDLRFTLRMLGVGSCAVAAGAWVYVWGETWKGGDSMREVLVMVVAGSFALWMVWGVPYALYQYCHLEGREKRVNI